MLRVERQGELAIWVVDRPQRRNAMDWATMQAFARAVEEAVRDPALRVVILTGAEGAFLSGADLYEMAHYRTEADGYRLGQVMGDALRQLEEAPWISIAAINGPARGGGVEVALACDLRVMAEDADLAFVQVLGPHSRVGWRAALAPTGGARPGAGASPNCSPDPRGGGIPPGAG